MIRVEQLKGGYNKQTVIHDLSFEIHKGEFFALLGPNGSGKTTIFKLVTGVLPLQNGQIVIDGKPLAQMSTLEKAKKMAVLTQESQVSFDFTVEEIVSLGRYAHQIGFLKSLSKKDQQVINEVMELTRVSQYGDKPFRMLSGGEKQRVLLAKALAQEPQVLLLDEPTNHLDIKHTFEILNLLKLWQSQKELTIFAILHDLNVASLYADRFALLQDGTFVDVGDAHILKKEEQLEEVYKVQIHTQSHSLIAKPQVLITPDLPVKEESASLFSSYKLEQNDAYIHIQFAQPLRVISNAVHGEGMQWLKHFLNFHVHKDYAGENPQDEIKQWITEANVPLEQAAGMMTAVQLEDMATITKRVGDYQLTAVVTAGVGNAVDITGDVVPDHARRIGTINSMVFIDGNLTDGALINAYMSATEAKTKALSDYKILDPQSKTIATGTSTDSLLIAATQRGEATPYAGSGTVIGKAIGHIIYHATQEALRHSMKRMKEFL